MKNIILCLFLLATVHSSAQIDEHGPVSKSKTSEEKKQRGGGDADWRERVVLGGNLGAFFGASTFVNVNPLLGYRITDNWAAGVGVNYLYFSNPLFNASLLGKSAWTRYYFLGQFFAHAEFENIRYGRSTLEDISRRNVNVLPVGLGYQSNYFGISVLYDLIQDPYSPYSTPMIRVGGMLGIGN